MLLKLIKKNFKRFYFSTQKQLPYATKIDLQDLAGMQLPLINILKDQILEKGPISFSQYWEKALLHEEHGYYMKKDVFNKKGDFITSVEISQMFGEILGIWVINFLNQIKAINIEELASKKKSVTSERPRKKIALLEFGPGRGTLMCDIIRVFAQFNLLDGVEINFIEFSSFLRKIQQENVLKALQQHNIFMKYDYTETKKSQVERFNCEDPNRYFSLRWFKLYEYMIFEDYGEMILKPGIKSINDGGQAPIVILAHEFFDALPANIFQYQHGIGWCEKLVNICHDVKKMKNFEFMLSDGPNENVKKILNPEKAFSSHVRKDIKHNDQIEIQPKSLVIVNSISELINKVNGAALIIDYGENHAFPNSARAIRNHKFIQQEDLLEYPGEVDLSAYVNFQHMASAAQQVNGIKTHGPMPQGLFLESMGLNVRLDMLCRTSSQEKTKKLESEYYRLVAPEEMGQIYKCFYIGKEKNGDVFPFISENQKQVFY